jgi:hypothetical protein
MPGKILETGIGAALIAASYKHIHIRIAVGQAVLRAFIKAMMIEPLTADWKAC